MSTEHLQIKLIHLAFEAKIIRERERRHLARWREDRDGKSLGAYVDLRFHRKTRVRNASRSTHLAYGYLRGRRYRQMEAKCHTDPNWTEVFRMIMKYDPTSRTRRSADIINEFQAWKNETPVNLAVDAAD